MDRPSCAFFGHRNFDYAPYEDIIRKRIVDLIENRGVTVFYGGGRGNFDGTCARIVWELKSQYPHIKNILVLSYHPTSNFEISSYYDESVYLLENKVLPRFAISHSNRQLVKTVDYVISGVSRPFGGAKSACDYAEHLLKTIFYVVKDIVCNDCDRAIREHEEAMKDEAYRKQMEEEIARSYERTKHVEQEIAKRAKKRRR